MLYLCGAGVLMARTVWRWLQLQHLPLKPTGETDVFSTSEPLPPLTLSWPKRAVVIPEGMEANPALIRHERAHLQHNDGEFTLLFLLLQHDVRRNGSVHNLQVLVSTNRCFEAEAANALLQWRAEPQPKSLKSVFVRMHFGISGEDPDELKEQIADFGW